MKKIYGTNTIVIPYGRDHSGAPITDPVVMQPPVLPTIPAAPSAKVSAMAWKFVTVDAAVTTELGIDAGSSIVSV